tara:strand:+ start:2394 stop:2822 length:429 start_codon:yes stop_codon:yes gene_type:complete
MEFKLINGTLIPVDNEARSFLSSSPNLGIVKLHPAPEGKRTNQQNSAMHKYFALLAQALCDAGLDMKAVLKPSIEIPWTPASAKAHLWVPIQDLMFNKTHTSDLSPKEVNAVYLTLSRHMSEKHTVDVGFPNSRSANLTSKI